MSIETYKKVLDNILSSSVTGQDFTIVWHAGEPLALPVAYYEEAVHYAKSVQGSRTIRFNVQTNGVNINESWCSFFKEYGISVGVSVDGPEHVHDAHRRKRNGAGTFREVLRGINHLNGYGVPFHTISVVSASSLPFAKEMFDFLSSAGSTTICLNIEETEGVNQRLVQFDADALARFYQEFFACWLKNQMVPKVREFQNMLLHVRDYKPTRTVQPWQDAIPFRIISVDHTGRYSTFSPELLSYSDDSHGTFTIGNLCEGPVEKSLNTDKFDRMYFEIAKGLSMCKTTCSFYSICGGGAPSNKYFENGTFESAETRHCVNSRQVLFKSLLEYLDVVL